MGYSKTHMATVFSVFLERSILDTLEMDWDALETYLGLFVIRYLFIKNFGGVFKLKDFSVLFSAVNDHFLQFLTNFEPSTLLMF